MTQELERLRTAAAHVLRRTIHVVRRDEWEARLRSGGEPTKLPAPLSPFSSVDHGAEVETYAMSARPFAQPGGFHVVRRDEADAPNIFNTDSYIELDLKSLPEWPQIVSTARIADSSEIERMISAHVFLSGPERRPDHHSSRVPPDIDGAKPK